MRGQDFSPDTVADSGPAFAELDARLKDAERKALIDTFGTAQPHEMSRRDRIVIAATAFAMKHVCGQLLNGGGSA